MKIPSTRSLRMAWVTSLISTLASTYLLINTFPDGVYTRKFVIAFSLMDSSLLVFVSSHVILMHREWRVNDGFGALHFAKKIVYWLLAPTLVAGAVTFVLVIASMLFSA